MVAKRKSADIQHIHSSDTAARLLEKMGVPVKNFSSGTLKVHSPIDGAEIGSVPTDTAKSLDAKISRAHEAFLTWRGVPAPKRGELIRLFGETLRAHKEDLGKLVTLECGKILTEGLGEVQEMIDICDFAVGLSRQLYGLTIASERAGHKMQENWHPAGVVGVISAFNFPVAVWCWNFALAIVCGDSVVWKPSEKTPLTALACQALFEKTLKKYGAAPEGLSEIVVGARVIGEKLVDDRRISVVSATGSTRMGREVAPRVAARFARCILELGGNNAMILAPSANLDLALMATVFGAVGTAGQRCTTQRRLIAHKDVAEKFVARVKKAYASVRIGSPLDAHTLLGPLIDKQAFDNMQDALKKAKAAGGKVTGGERVLAKEYPHAYYVAPAVVEMPKQADVVQHETFAPILYVMKYSKLGEALAMHNGVPQGLSSCIFTNDLREAELFTSAAGSDCGIANVNLGTSGAEIGGAFGGEKETGGGRESGSDAWKAYMRRSTNTVNYSSVLPLAQGVQFDI
ncbi:MAG: aldehyde dehydrogenase family protein [Alphaproteobacteria bacterium]|nr:aldehyde dehydrogenase family protein [Alphaproteobacteria bacterium]MDE2336869.1 aldehyde dehydrogenase family protein [Alphaproteobacteria bacterium]